MTHAPQSKTGVPAKRVLGIGAVLLAAWAVFAGLVAPWLIRQGYAGESIPVVNSMFGGRDVHPVDFYLGALRSVVLLGSGLLIAALAVSVPWFVFAERRRSWIDRVLHGPAPMAPGTLIRFAAWTGLIGGGVEAVYLGIRQMVTTRPASGFHTELLWMAPLSGLMTVTCMGVVLALLARSGRGRIGLYKAAFPCGFLVIQGLLNSEGVALLGYAELIVALGFSALVARSAVAWADPLRRAVRSSGKALAALVVILLGSAAWTAPARAEARALASAPEAPTGVPNLLLIILDTVRARNLSLYGYDRPTTPRIDEWARQGTVFDRAIATSSWTIPSHSSLFTGELDPATLTGEFVPLADRFETLAEVLAAEGYATAAFTANHWYTTSMSGLQQGFARFEDRPITVPYFLWSSWLVRTFIAEPLLKVVSFHVVGTKDAATTTGEFFDWLDGRPQDRPFFAFLNLMDAHDPFATPLEWSQSFGPAPTTSWPVFKGNYRPDPDSPVNAAEMHLWVNQYDEAIAYMDHHLGRLRERLESQGLLQNTVVVITSDHGEMFGEQDELVHRRSLYTPTIHVPMMMVWPGQVPGGLRVSTPVSIRDIPSTFGTLARIERLAAFPGTSLTTTWAAPDADHPDPMAHLRPFEEGHEWWAPINQGAITSIVRGDLQFIQRTDGHEELYHLIDDPDQGRNLAGDPAYSAILESLRAAVRPEVGGGGPS